MNANHVTLAGFTTGPAELKFTEKGRAITTLMIAYNRKPMKEGEKGAVDFIEVKVWGKNAEAVAEACDAKGVPLIVTGPIRQDRWEKNGQKQSRLTVEAYLVARQILAERTNSQPEGGE